MVLDTSALLAILFDEPERRDFNVAIQNADQCLLSSGNYLETEIVLERRFGFEAVRDFRLFLKLADIEVVPFDLEQANIAGRAYRTFGKGRHQAALNFGDCFAYALAKIREDVLLFKGEDFRHTDVRPVKSA